MNVKKLVPSLGTVSEARDSANHKYRSALENSKDSNGTLND